MGVKMAVEKKESEPKSPWVKLKPENAHEIAEIRHKRLRWLPNQMINNLEINVDHFETLLDRLNIDCKIELARLKEQPKKPELSISGVNKNGEAMAGKVAKEQKVKKSKLSYKEADQCYLISINFDELISQSQNFAQSKGKDTKAQWEFLARRVEKEIKNQLIQICESHIIFLGLRDLLKTLGAGACAGLIVSGIEFVLAFFRWKFEAPPASIEEVTILMGIVFVFYLSTLEKVFSQDEGNEAKTFLEYLFRTIYLYFWFSLLSSMAGAGITHLENGKLIRSTK
jgi:hypothetical protein